MADLHGFDSLAALTSGQGELELSNTSGSTDEIRTAAFPWAQSHSRRQGAQHASADYREERHATVGKPRCLRSSSCASLSKSVTRAESLCYGKPVGANELSSESHRPIPVPITSCRSCYGEARSPIKFGRVRRITARSSGAYRHSIGSAISERTAVTGTSTAKADGFTSHRPIACSQRPYQIRIQR